MVDDAAWFEDEPDRDRPRARRRAVLVATVATIPWLVAATVFLGRATAGPEPTPSSSAVEAGGIHHHEPTGTDPTTAADDAADDAGDVAGEAAIVPTDSSATTGDATAVALAVARAWLSDVGPDVPIPGLDRDRRAYLEHVAVRRIDVLGPDAAVVTLAVIMLERDDDRYVAATPRQAAVPLTLTATGVQPAGMPWWLPTDDDLRPVAPRLRPEPAAADHDAVAAALLAVGYLDVEVDAIAHGEGDLVVATIRATTPQGDVIDGDVWLSRDRGTYLPIGASAPASKDGGSHP